MEEIHFATNSGISCGELAGETKKKYIIKYDGVLDLNGPIAIHRDGNKVYIDKAHAVSINGVANPNRSPEAIRVIHNVNQARAWLSHLIEDED